MGCGASTGASTGAMIIDTSDMAVACARLHDRVRDNPTDAVRMITALLGREMPAWAHRWPDVDAAYRNLSVASNALMRQMRLLNEHPGIAYHSDVWVTFVRALRAYTRELSEHVPISQDPRCVIPFLIAASRAISSRIEQRSP
jgi:hypothetical protein